MPTSPPLEFPFFRIIAVLFAAAPFAAVLAIRDSGQPVSFNREVAPILRAHCTSCHGSKEPAAGLDLTTAESTRKSIVEKQPGKSILLQRILGHGGKDRMPLGFAPLSPEQTSIIERWIKEGGRGDEKAGLHWSYLPIQNPSIPVVRNAEWVRNPIDSFVLAKLEKLHLGPTSEATKEALIRRVSLDLTGLPPSIAEIDAFLADKRPDAYERVVDRLLASPQYGERQARFWLDLARYADTDGFADLPRTAWMYRDWVINAFNKNMPFDQFTIEQLAGDLIPNRTHPDRFIATGFHRNTMFDAEMGGDPEEAHLNVIADRVSTTSTVWLGSTLQCARCHDHKYDPFTQKDFYAMAAFFNATSHTPTNPGEAKGRWLEPLLEFPSNKQVAEREQLKRKILVTDNAIHKWTPEKRAAMEAWKQAIKNPGWITQEPKVFVRSGTNYKRLDDGSLLATGSASDDDKFVLTFTGWSGKATGIRLEFIPDPSLPAKGSGRANDGSLIITKVAATLDGKPLKISEVGADYNFPEMPATNLLLEKSDGWTTYKQETKPHELVMGFEKPVALDSNSKLVLEVTQEGDELKTTIGCFRASLATYDHPASLAISAHTRELVTKEKLEPDDQKALDEAFFASAGMFESQRSDIRKAKMKLSDLAKNIPSTMILQEGISKDPLKIPLRVRGEFLNKGPDIEANTPEILPPIDQKSRVDRLALANWLVSKRNPLTARVLANRLWEQSFGHGIVETSEDFGVRGSLPSHPELLDWMAVQLQNGWNIKAMQRKIVTSATYRQSSRSTAKNLKDDPKNSLLARGPKVRLDAETVRDASLTYGGLLSRKIGGPSVFPYQPKEVTENNNDWSVSHGTDAYRRSLYTFMQRGYPFALFQIFDAASRSECTVRRVNTTTPLQALALLNDEGMMEAADALGRRMMGVSNSDEQRIIFGFRTCTSRRPSPSDIALLKKLLVQVRQRYKSDPKSAKELSGTPERSSWTMIGNVLLNMDETINRN